jgi:hypothetical protein
MNRLQTTIGFMFTYDGTSSSIDIDTRRGAVIYQSGLPPMFFSEIAVVVVSVSVSGASPTGATISGNGPATISNRGILTISNLPGFAAGSQVLGSVTLAYDVG